MGLAKSLRDSGYLGADDVARIARSAADAARNDGALAVQIGDTGTFAVRNDDDGRGLMPGEYVRVQTKSVEAVVGAKVPVSRLRWSTIVNAQLRCKVNIVFNWKVQ